MFPFPSRVNVNIEIPDSKIVQKKRKWLELLVLFHVGKPQKKSKLNENTSLSAFGIYVHVFDIIFLYLKKRFYFLHAMSKQSCFNLNFLHFRFFLFRVSDPERDYSDDERTTLMTSLEEYVVRLMRLPVSDNALVAAIQEEVYEQYQAKLIADVEYVRSSLKFVSGFLRRHRIRVRRQEAAATR